MIGRFGRVAMVAGAIVLAGSLPLLAARGRPGGGHCPWGGEGRLGRGPGMPDRLAQELDLTEAQREQFRNIVRQHMDGDLGERIEAMHAARARMRSVVHDPQSSEDQVLEAVRQMTEQAAPLALEQHRLSLALDRILTDEQRVRAREFFERRFDDRDDGRPGRGHGPHRDW